MPVESELPRTILRLVPPERRGSRELPEPERIAPVHSRRAVRGFGTPHLVWLPVLGHIAPRAPQIVAIDGERTIILDRGHIRYESVGDGDEAVVLLHGFHSQLAAWNDVWPHVTSCERRIRLDLPGYGGSRWPSDSYALPDQAERVLRFLDGLGLTRVTLVGVSMGGSLAAWLAGMHPDRVRGLVLLAPSAYPGALRYRGVFGTVLRSGLARRLATQVAASPLYRHVYPSSQALHALTVTASYGKSWLRALEQIRVHTWLVWSRGDRTVPYEYATSVASAIRSCTLVPLADGVGHDIPGKRPELIGKLACRVHRGAAPDELLRELRDELQRKGDR